MLPRLLKRIRAILRYTSPRDRIPRLLPNYRSGLMGDEETYTDHAADEDRWIIGAGLAQTVAEAQEMRHHFGDAWEVMQHLARPRRRQRVPGCVRLWRRISKWLF